MGTSYLFPVSSNAICSDLLTSFIPEAARRAYASAFQKLKQTYTFTACAALP
jgi:hypothetical protein